MEEHDYSWRGYGTPPRVDGGTPSTAGPSGLQRPVVDDDQDATTCSSTDGDDSSVTQPNVPTQSTDPDTEEVVKDDAAAALDYYFESDHPALRDNEDYRALLRTICILQVQRKRAVQDLGMIHKTHKEALADPLGFVEKLQRGELNLPSMQKIVSMPPIDWGKYLPADGPSFSHRHMTRKKHDEIADSNSSAPILDDIIIPRQKVGLSSLDERSQTYKVKWTAEEHKLFEELLVEFPMEEVEARRWKKIAKAMGSRTSQQVASHAQKYFIYLTKRGLPVPGRIPNLTNHIKRNPARRHRHSAYLFGPSNFLASYRPPIYMNEDDDMWSSCNVSAAGSSVDDQSAAYQSDSSTDNEDDSVPAELQASAEYKELIYLKNLRKEKKKIAKVQQHIGFKCDGCQSGPIVGTRWHCLDCPPDKPTDLCEDCVESMHETEAHPQHHRLEPMRPTSNAPYIDNDYKHFLPRYDR